MGIEGLEDQCRAWITNGNLEEFRGKNLGIDMSIWLHACARQAVQMKTSLMVKYAAAEYGKTNGGSAALPPISDVLLLQDNQIVKSVKKMVSKLRQYGVTPFCVFDGKKMPMKSITHKEREESRQKAFQDAMYTFYQLYCVERRQLDARASGAAKKSKKSAKLVLSPASQLFVETEKKLRDAISVSSKLTHAVIRALQAHGVKCLVAPYEADAQLAYLCQEGHVDGVVSEDSDLIAYYCPCRISKLDLGSGKCEVLRLPQCNGQFFRSLAAATCSGVSARILGEMASGALNASGDSESFRSTLFREVYGAGCIVPSLSRLGVSGVATITSAYQSFLLMCVMPGCDYVKHMPGVGITQALAAISQSTLFGQVFTALENQYGCPKDALAEYRPNVLKAFYGFAHHLVYCQRKKEIVSFFPLPHGMLLKSEVVGERWDAKTAQDVCVDCVTDPHTLLTYE